MATVSSPQPTRTPPTASRQSRSDANANGQAASDLLIASRIAEAQTALWRAELSRVLLIPVMAVMIGLVAWAVMDQWIWSPNRIVRTLVLVGGIAALAAWFVKRVFPLMSRQIQPEYAAYSLEHDLPELRHSLTSYVSLREDQQREGVRGLVVRSIGVRAAGQLQSHQLEVPSEATGNLAWWLGVAGALAMAAAYALFSPKDTLQSTKRLLLPLSSIAAPTRVAIEDVQPGSIEVLAGRPFEVSARISGLSSAETPVVEFGELFNQHRALQKNAESGRYLASIRVDGPSEYRIVAGDTVAGPFVITTRDVPVVAIEQVTITPPAYTKLPVRTARGGAIVAEENAFAKVDIRTNRPVERARIEFNPRVTGDKTLATGGFLEMKLSTEGTSGTVSFPAKLAAKSSGAVTFESYRIRVWDSQGNENPDPIVYPIRIVADLVPEIAIMAPTAALTEVPINAAKKVEIHSLDPDYGLRRIDVQVRKGIDLVHTDTIWSSVEGEKGGRDLVWVFKPQSLGLRVDDTVQVAAIASDNRHDSAGQPAPNVVTSDAVEFKVVARDENARLPNFDEPKAADEQSDGNESKKPGEQGGTDGDKGQGGQGGAGGSESGASSEGEAGGESGSGSSGKQGGSDKNKEGKQDGQGGQGGASSEMQEGDEASDSEAQDAKANASNENQSNSGKGNSDGKAGASGQPGNKDNPAPSSDAAAQQPPGEQAAGEQAAGDQATGEGQQSDAGKPAGSESTGASNGKPAGKPQHDGDAFERIRDFMNEKEQAKEAGSGDSQPQVSDAGNSQGGESKPGESQPGESQPGESQPGESQPGESQPGESKAGHDAEQDKSQESGAQGNAGGDQNDPSMKAQDGEGEPSQGQSEPADSKTGEPARKQGEQGAGSKPQGGNQKPTSDSQPAMSEAGKSGAGSDAEGQPTNDKINEGQGNEGQGNEGQGNEGQGNEGQGNEGQGKEGQGKEGQGNNEGQGNENAKPANEKNTATDQAKQGKREAKNAERDPGKGVNTSEAGDDATFGSEAGGTPSPGKGTSAGQPGDSDADKARDGSAPSSGGKQAGEPEGEAPADAALPPDPVDVEYAKKATELVLDYLETQKETPDPKLLENLDWTPEELRSFVDRWSRLKTDAAKSAGDQQQIEEALKSLGIRAKQDGPLGRDRDSDDALRGLRDAGNRTPPPTLYRDAFDAFRRNANRK